MTTEEWIGRAEMDFLDQITGEKSLSSLAACAHGYLENPFFLINMKGEIYCMPPENAPYHDPLWEEFGAKGFVPVEKRMFLEGMRDPRSNKLRQIYYHEHCGTLHRVMCYWTKIGKDFDVCGVMLESKKPFHPEDERVFEIFVKSAAYLMEYHKWHIRFQNHTDNFFLHNLLSGAIDSSHVRDINAYLRLEEGSHIRFLVIKSAFDNSARLLHGMDELKDFFPVSTPVLYQERLVLFFQPKKNEMTETIWNRLIAYLKKKQLQACVSFSYPDYRYIRQEYMRVRHMLEIGNALSKNMPLFFAEDLQWPYLLEKFDRRMLSDFIFQPVSDRQHTLEEGEDQLLYTLYVYAAAFGNTSSASRQSGIHYNTLCRRLQKAEKILGCNIDRYLISIYITIKILYLVGLKEQDLYLEYDNMRRIRGKGL